MASCAEKKAAWQTRVLVIDDETAPLPLAAAGIIPDVLYSCEGAITYAPLNPLGYRIPEVLRGTQKATGREAPETRPFVYLEVSGVAGGTHLLHGRRNTFQYLLDGSTVRIGPMGPYNCGPGTRFTVSGSTPTVELVIEDGENRLPDDADTGPEMVEAES